ncbi:hypothetical protein BH23CHL9_BH23CHL9_05000 [soil metagenome]
MNLMRGAVGGIVILAATVGGVAAVAFALGAWIAPAASLVEPTPTPEPTFDLAVAPDAIGGSLEITGDRTGTMVLDTASGIGGRYEVLDDGGISIRPDATAELRGADGHIRFDGDSGQVTHIAYDGLSIYVDPGQCEITHGAVKEATELMAALIECPDIADVRGQGVISVAGVVALPADALRGRGDLPPTGGSVEVAGRTIPLDEAEIFLDGEPLEETGRIQWGVIDADRASGILLEYDPGADRWFLCDAFSNNDYATLEEPCPMAAEELGRINEYTTVVRLEIDCTDVAVAGGGTGSVTGTIVADVIQGYTDTLPEP